MILYRFSNKLSIVIRRAENFLKAFEKHFTRKTCIFEAYVNPISLRVNFSKIQIFWRFLTYNSFGMLYNTNSFSGIKTWCLIFSKLSSEFESGKTKVFYIFYGSCQNNEEQKEYLESPQTPKFRQFDGSKYSLYFDGI